MIYFVLFELYQKYKYAYAYAFRRYIVKKRLALITLICLNYDNVILLSNRINSIRTYKTDKEK